MGTEYTVYLVCAVAGCTLVALQLVLQLFGFLGDVDMDSGDHDFDLDHDFDHDAGHGADGHGNLFFGILSFKAISAFVGIFGLVGLITLDTDLGFVPRTLIAFGAGTVSMFAVAQLMLTLVRLQASGTVDIRNAIGQTGSVYLRIPESGEGRGKVTVKVQGRTMECAAISEGPAIATGGQVKIVSVEGGVLRVTPA